VHGDLWQLGAHRLICGDSTAADVVGRLLGDVRPLLMVTDPPYGVEYDPSWRNQAGAATTIAGDPCEIELGWSLPSGESLTFTIHAVYLPRPRVEVPGPQGIQATFDWQAAVDPALGRMCTVMLINERGTY